ncbi:glycosyltransferase family 90 protein [Thermothelomyces thermophilus ATCC 42464]|uniref:Glycosyltransferase family 90 protein n=1 Tax=Thermothelomyces thermophilus (strain ATCC 42464 / BCRC 31852 / DSM 1799) TaxID=573729 RepID=G2QND3_THET4|nr:glycosyltransferase family 90 protein [Thermothelomyces thermophilus ATCC 42464]AEO62006.1 glycosyltransferase family 90 protein [Thermothelomyces thermophilus ATCC 42464]
MVAAPSWRRRRWFEPQPWALLRGGEVEDPGRPVTTTATTAAIAAGLAALSASGAHRLSSLSTAAGGVSQAGEVVSEAVCWALLAAVAGMVGKRRRRRRSGAMRARADEGDDELLEGGMGLLWPDDGASAGGGGGGGAGHVGGSKDASERSVWAVAAGIVVACCYAAEIGEISLFPALTPLLLVADRKLRPRMAPSPPQSGLAALANTVWGTTLVAAVAMLALVDWSLLELALPLLPAAALLLVYAALMPRSAGGPRLLPLIPDIEEAIQPLSHRILILLGGVLGARHTSWCTATTLGTFGLVASQDPSFQLSDLDAALPVIVSLLVLAQLVSAIPKQARGRLLLWALCLVSVGPYLANTAAIGRAQSAALHSLEHPVEVLIRSAKADFERLLERQSRTYSAAVEEYRRRYGIEPPPGFREWFEFAVENRSPIVDEFDMISESVSPFWRLGGKEVAQIMDEAYDTAGIDLWLCSFSGATAETSCSHPVRTFDRHIGDLFNTLLGDLPGVLPDAKFLVNHLDEPRVLIPPGSGPPSPDKKKTLSVTDFAERPTWDAITKYCGASRVDRERGRRSPPPPPPPVETYGLPLVTNLSAALDLCAHPEYAETHGLFRAPASFRLIEGLVPVLSTGKPSTMSDIPFPSPAYVVEPEFRYEPSDDVPWSHKSDHLYWAGSTTGGVARTDNDWRRFHRQRFLALAQNLDPEQQHIYLRQEESNDQSAPAIRATRTGFLNTRLYRAYATRIFQCRPGAVCRRERAHLRGRARWARQAAGAALRARLVLDLDGNGISGRFRRLLASRSCVLKQTVLREWWHGGGSGDGGGLVVPWVHYVPVSVGMGELPELVAWFLGTDRGREAARRVGEEGAQWAARAMRDVDFKVYLWRLVLELARLADVTRGPLLTD